LGFSLNFQQNMSFNNSQDEFTMPIEKPALILLGAPGVGKSTQTQRLIEQIPGIMCVSTGNLVRKLNKKVEDQQPLNALEKKAAESLYLMRQGKIMDADAVYALLMAYLSPAGEGHDEYLKSHTLVLDGIIKDGQGIKAFESALSQFNASTSSIPLSIKQVVNLSASHDELIARHDNRIAQATANDLPQRPDDEIHIYTERLKKYQEDILEVIHYYQIKEQMKEIDSSSGIEQTTKAIIAVLEEINPSIKRTLSPAHASGRPSNTGIFAPSEIVKANMRHGNTMHQQDSNNPQFF
jgi:adenylate kinase family enzyme